MWIKTIDELPPRGIPFPVVEKKKSIWSIAYLTVNNYWKWYPSNQYVDPETIDAWFPLPVPDWWKEKK